MGWWWITSQRALSPQVPGQGSVHLYLWQARFVEHSALTTHSGLQFGGDPWYSGRHEHTAFPFFSMHLLFGPHGDGVHGWGVSGGMSVGQDRDDTAKFSEILNLEKNICKYSVCEMKYFEVVTIKRMEID